MFNQRKSLSQMSRKSMAATIENESRIVLDKNSFLEADRKIIGESPVKHRRRLRGGSKHRYTEKSSIDTAIL